MTQTTAPALDLDQARRFLRALAGSEETPVTFQTFSDSKPTKGAQGLTKILHGPLSEHAEELQRLNKLGAGIFIAVNEMDGKGRTATNVTRVRALFCDWDTPESNPLRIVQSIRPTPHIVVESSPGKVHAYWQVIDCPLATFSEIQRALAKRHGSDPKVCDLPRVMRVPGFMHRKGEPVRTRLADVLDAPAYTLAELRAGLLPQEDSGTRAASKATQGTTPKARAQAKASTDELERIGSALCAIPAKAWDDRDLWVRLGMAAYSYGAAHDCLDACFALWCEAARVSAKFDKADSRKTWDSFSAKPSGISIATLYREAGAAGWDDPRRPFRVTAEGVYYLRRDQSGAPLAPLHICGPLGVIATATDERGGNWGHALKFKDRAGHDQLWVMPDELLAGEAAELRAELLKRGLWISTNAKARQHLTDYINARADLPAATYTTAPGWLGTAYVTPERVYGGGGRQILFQGEAGTHFMQRGEPEGWRDNVSALAVGNSRLAFAISTAFAAPLLHMTGEDSGGFHFGGDSSQGKTSIVRAAASVWGGRDYIHTWRATSNGLEGVAQQHNDGLLVLDELNQVEPREAGEAAYMLANGRGKARALRSGAARRITQWRLLYLSTGELGLAAHMAKAGQRTEAGQSVRLAEIPADAENGLGIYEALHGRKDGASLSTDLVRAAAEYHGAVGVRFLEHLTADYEAIAADAKVALRRITAELLPAGAEGQAQRGGGRFALAAVAGELATTLGLTGWPEGEAVRAAKLCFSAWLAARGGSGNQERRDILRHVRRFLEAHGQSRFQPKGDKGYDIAGDNRTVINRAGFRHQTGEGETWFYVLPEAYAAELCAGRAKSQVSSVLRAAGWLLHDEAGGKNARSVALPGMGQVRCYVLGPQALQADIP